MRPLSRHSSLSLALTWVSAVQVQLPVADWRDRLCPLSGQGLVDDQAENPVDPSGFW